MSLALVAASASAQTMPATTAASRPSFDPGELLGGPDLSPEQEEARSRLEAVLAAATDPLDKAAAQAALANWLLAVPTSKAATRWIIGTDRPQDLRLISESAVATRERLAKAASSLKEPEAADADKTRRKRLTTHIENLNALASVLALAGGAEGGDEAKHEAWSHAAVSLSEARESDNAQLTSSATLWQAMAWEQAGRRERALTTLPDALINVEQSYDFMSRILRCRILGDGGRCAAALALASQIRARVDEWYPSEKPDRRRARQRLVGLLQLRIGQVWMDNLRTGTQPADAELLNKLMVDVRQNVFLQGVKSEVYVLERAVPILVEPPAIKTVASTPASSPASLPDN